MAALLAVAMMFQMLPMMAFAAEDTPLAKGHAKIGDTEYDTVKEAVEKAVSGDTIELGEGNYSLYGISSTGMTSGKDLTFVGQGTDKTVWYIGADVPDPNKTGEYNGDYSFDGAGTVTFEDMTLRSGPTKDPNTKLGFIRPDNTVVENCEIVGWTAFWGYNSAEFKNTTFKPIVGKDAIWVYSSKEATFNKCIFTAGRGVKVYTEENKSVTVNFNNCTVEDSGSHPAIYIDEYVLERDGGTQRYTINITGNNNVTAQTNTDTCSKLFGFRKANAHPGHFTNVSIDGKLVWSEGKMLTHDYTDGEKEQAYDITYSAWRQWDERNDERDVTRKCKYCGWEENYTERASVYRLQYNLNGGTGAEGANYDDALWRQDENVTLAAAPSREGYNFVGWKDAAGRTYSAKAETVLKGDTVLTAQWADPANDPILTVEGGTITAKKDGAELTLNIQEVGDTQKTAVPAGAEVTVELNKDAIPQNMNFDRWTLDGWTLDDEMLKNELDAALNQETITFTMPTHDLSVEAVYQGTAGDSGDSSVVSTVLIATGATAIGYYAGTQVLKHCYGLPYWPGNRSALALMLWEDADRPMPVSTVLYPDVGQKERDMDLQHAARWAMENELIPDLNLDDSKPEEEQKFFPNYAVSRAWALHAWNKAQKLKKNA